MAQAWGVRGGGKDGNGRGSTRLDGGGDGKVRGGHGGSHGG